jgi:hypothetical protein
MSGVRWTALPILVAVLGFAAVAHCQPQASPHPPGLAGRVVEASTGAPIEGALVSFVWSST